MSTSQIHRRTPIERAAFVAEKYLAPRAANYDRSTEFPSDNIAELHSAGLTSLLIHESLGGCGGTLSTYVEVIENLARACGSTALVYAMHCGATQVISSVDSNRAREIVRGVVNDGHLVAWAFSEPGIGGNVLAPTVTVRPSDGGRFSVQGVKSFCTGAGYADHYLVNGESGVGEFLKSQTLVVLDAAQDGITVDHDWDGLGMRANQANTLHLNTNVNESSLLEGRTGAMPLLAVGIPTLMLGLAATSIGLAQNAFDYALAHITRRVHVDKGHPLAGYQSVRAKIADAAATLHCARLAVRHAAQDSDHDPLNSLQSVNMAKLVANTAALSVADSAMDVCGGHGFLRRNPLERCFRDSRAGAVMGANLGALRDMIGRSLLGMDVL